ncbi:MAG TPA: cytochrome P450 [Mycobacteriales bacterium]|nr:cytochrome P450 [Mycobacteriales bacterium]
MTDATTAVYYDPYDFAIDDDPYPVWKRLRDEAPLYYNEQHDFYAISRYDDVDRALLDWETYRSGKGTLLDVIKADVQVPSGVILWEDPPLHDLHRSALARVFTPRRMAAVEDRVREYCRSCLDPLVGSDRIDFIADLGASVPMRTIGFLMGIPESEQAAVRGGVDDKIRLEAGGPGTMTQESIADAGSLLAEYVDWRYDHPADDLMTELINVLVDEADGSQRRLSRDEVVMYATMVAGAGNETATRLIGFAAEQLARHPEQRHALADDRSLAAGAVEEALRFEAPSPVQGRVTARPTEHHGQAVPEGATMLILNGAANRDERVFAEPDRFDIHRAANRHLSFGKGLHFCLGAALARLEGRVALEEIVSRWRDWEIEYDGAHKAHTSSVRGWAALPARLG